jgi:hypothetical protein
VPAALISPCLGARIWSGRRLRVLPDRMLLGVLVLARPPALVVDVWGLQRAAPGSQHRVRVVLLSAEVLVLVLVLVLQLLALCAAVVV